ncbi:hypothetical protein ACJMK2_044605 [Sinanodonta woodiana]|uniref:Coiled-coil domain-containing protein 87 n=1 Tax=Sinanodonta woodiana TaxID=1069815 RepID=A0ABD3W465_SINWO
MPAETKTVQFRGFKTDSQFQRHKQDGNHIPDHPEKHGDMYSIKWPDFNNMDVENRIQKVLGPLSLFDPTSNESADGQSTLGLERPVTPVDEEIKVQPTSFDRLAGFIRRRVAAKPEVPYLSIEDQQNLAGILMGEVSGIWSDIKRQIDDPFLTPEENRELNRRISVHIVTVCEQLFQHYLKKAQVLNRRGIFSGPANMSRLKAQLALDANKFLNILTIRRYIVADIRGSKEQETESEDFIFTPQKPESAVPKLSYKGLIEASRPKSRVKRFRYQSPEQEAKKISSNMPTLDTSKLMSLIAHLPERPLETPSEESEGTPSRSSGRDSKEMRMTEEEKSHQKVLLKRVKSLPEIPPAENLLEELGIEASIKDDTLSEYEVQFMKRENHRTTEKAVKEESESPRVGTREYAAEDLRQLVSQSQEEFKVEEDMPPLLQAITRNIKYDGRKKILDQQLKELEEKERKEKERQNIPLRKPIHPQPATTTAKMPNQMKVRTSDIRVSERVCMSSITLNRFTTVYNDLVDDIDAHTVKLLDRNLFLGEEIKEVYQEIMKTVPTTHLELDDDVMVTQAADNVNLSGMMASATLAQRKTDRVINPSLHRERLPPWGEMDPKQWVKTPSNPPKNFQGEDVFAPLTPNIDRVHEVLRNPSKMAQILSSESMPTFVADKMARTYASWLQWWKSTVTSDDYMKYLSTQETDYMGVIFHFYDSEDDEDDIEEPAAPLFHSAGVSNMAPTMPFQQQMTYQSQQQQMQHPMFQRHTPGKKSASRTTSSSKATELQKEREKKIEDLKKVKTEFKEGLWNVNSIMMGGLGKDPVLEEDEDQALSRSIKSADTSRSAKTLQEKAAARLSAKIQARDAAQSRLSKVTTLTTMSKTDFDSPLGESEMEAPLTPQERLERVWKNLEMPDSQKLDMAIKYSCNEFYNKLSEAILRWEKVTELILKREDLLAKLERFERNASDPNRFFEKGPRGHSVMRLKEAQQRSYYTKRIDFLDSEIKVELKYIKENFRDVITFKGRPYEDKIKWDRIEMLHWLQEERKQNAIKYEALKRQITYNQLEPLPPRMLAPNVS